jgi:UMF1 family MFS transporter
LNGRNESNKLQVISWSLYDFANSAFTTLIVTFIYSTYFTKSIAANEIEGTVLWSRAINLTAIFVALLSPVVGALADHGGYRKRFLFFTTAIAVICSAMLYFPLPGEVTKALTWFIIGNIAFEMSAVFYNAFLPDISDGKNIGKISGYGWSLGYIGGLLAMFIAMVGLVNPETPWFGISKEAGEHIRATNLLVAAWFAIFSIPIFLFLKDKNTRRDIKLKRKIRAGFRELLSTLKTIGKYRQIVLFLLARLIYNDGLVTIFAFGGIYAAGTFNFSFEEIMIFGVVLNIAAGLGAFFMGFTDDKLGGKRTIQISLIALIIASIMAVFAPNKTIFWIAGIIVGLFAGPNQSASRSLMGRFVPAHQKNEFFGFFSFSGKLTAFLGPLFLGILTQAFQSQRAGVFVVVVFFVVGGIILNSVNEEKGMVEAQG